MITPTTYTTTRPYPKRIKPDQDATYRAALELVARIDEDLTTGTGHYYTKRYKLLTTLDEVIVAILAGNLLMPEGLAA